MMVKSGLEKIFITEFVVWEIFSLGRSPYGQQGYEEVMERLENGYRLPCPREATEISAWSAEKLYRKISNVYFEKTGAPFFKLNKLSSSLYQPKSNYLTRPLE